MKKKIITRAFIFVLVLSNVFFIWRFLAGPPHPRHGGPKQEIISRLKFDAGQIKKYEGLIKIHRKQIRAQEFKIRKAKKIYFSHLKQNSKEIDTLQLLKIQNAQAEIEKAHYLHFYEIKSLCRKDQQDEFSSLIDELGELFSHGPPPPHKPRK